MTGETSRVGVRCVEGTTGATTARENNEERCGKVVGTRESDSNKYVSMPGEIATELPFFDRKAVPTRDGVLFPQI